MLKSRKLEVFFIIFLAFIGQFWNLYSCIRRIVVINSKALTFIGLMASVSIISYLLIASFLRETLPFRNKKTRILISILLSVIGIAVISYVNLKFLDMLINDGTTGRYSVALLGNFKQQWFIMVIFLWACMLLEEADDRAKIAEKENVIIAKEKDLVIREKEVIQKELELAKNGLLNEQIHPHAIVNGISAISVLLDGNIEKARKGLSCLADYIRSLVNVSKNIYNYTLRDEKNIVEQYLCVEELRLSGRLEIIWDWDSKLETTKIPPLALQTLVENAIKHGVATTTDPCKLQIDLEKQTRSIRLSVSNTGTSLEDKENHGTSHCSAPHFLDSGLS